MEPAGALPRAEVEAAFARDALPWIDNVYRFARSLCHDAADADDLVQDTFLRAYRSWHTFQPGTDCRRWLFTICRNVFRQKMSSAANTVSLDAAGDMAPLRDVHQAGAVYAGAIAGGYEDIFTRLDVLPALRRALNALQEPYRSTLILVDVEDQTYESAAEVLDVPIGTVRSRLFRARRMMQEHLVAVANDAGLAGDWRSRRAG